MEYVFSARKGQRITVKNANTSMFDVRIFSGEFDLETEFDSSRTFSIDASDTGDYMLFVRKKMTGGSGNSRFSVTLSIR